MKNLPFFLILTISVIVPSITQATSLLPISLQQLSTRATTVFYGVVIDNQTRKDEQTGHIATFTTFVVIDPIKGEVNNTHTIKQIGGHDKESNMSHHVYGVPSFQTGKEYIVFLPEASSLGFSSPLGLQQGQFSVTSDNGDKFVGNGYRQDERRSIISKSKRADTHDSIHTPLSVSSDTETRSRLDDFISTVRAYNMP